MIQNPHVFQCDAEIVKNIYQTRDNYLIEYNSENIKSPRYCVIYFCSHNIYYPNTERTFRTRIVEKDFYEWYNLRMERAQKHIFIRDIHKQWYLTGVNSKVDSPEKLLAFLQQETSGYNVITLGSSAGGYAAMLYGSLLKAERIFAFNPQLEINSLLTKSNPAIDPLVFRLQNTPLRKYYDLNAFIKNANIFYSYSNKSEWDVEQNEHVEKFPGLHCIAFSSPRHGIPFLKAALPVFLNTNEDKLIGYTGHIQHPILFSIKLVGIRIAIIGLIKQTYGSGTKRFLKYLRYAQ